MTEAALQTINDGFAYMATVKTHTGGYGVNG